jgi:molecular chaperone DnaJ
MAAINDAYRVLRDPTTRSQYDSDQRAKESDAEESSATRRSAPPLLFTPRPFDTSPARYPWKLVGGMAAFGIVVVIVGAALYEPAEPVQLDNVLQVGSCVEIEANNDVREASCDGAADLVVKAVVPFDERCPTGLSAHRDRQGMGTACITRLAPAP